MRASISSRQIASDAAADPPGLPVKAAAKPQAYDWSGFYFGGHVGYGSGHAGTTVWDPGATPGANTFGGLIGGVQLGYNVVLPSRILLGLETDLTFANATESNALLATAPTARSNVTEQYDYTGATAIAVVMLVASFALLLAINSLQAWTRRRQGH